MKLGVVSFVALFALGASTGACGEPFTTAGPDSGPGDGAKADRTAGDGPADQRATDSWVDRGATDSPAPDAGCAAPDGAPAATCVSGLGEVIGWNFVSYEPGGTVCPAGYDSPTTVLMPGGPASCTCDCSDATVTCAMGMIDVGFGTGGTCPTKSTVSSSGCTNLLTPIAGGSSASAGPVTANTTPCMPIAGKSVPPDPSGLVCSAQLGSGCGKLEVCVPVPLPAQICVEHKGAVNCPLKSLTRSVVATGYSDTRDCAKCSCPTVSAGSCFAQVDLFPGMNCISASVALVADGTCRAVPTTASTYNSYDFTLKPMGGGSCIPSPAAAIGDETATGVKTLCCL